MKRIQVVQTSDVIAMAQRISVRDTIEIGQLMAAIQMIEKTVISERTVFDVANEEFGVGQSGWPKEGRWEQKD